MRVAAALELIGVDRSASLSDVRRAYRLQALKCHPDKSRASDATARFQLLGEALVAVLAFKHDGVEIDDVAAGDATAGAAGDVGQWTAGAANVAGGGIVNAADATGGAFATAGQWTAGAAVDSGQAIGGFAVDAGQAIGGVGGDVGSAIGDVAGAIGSALGF